MRVHRIRQSLAFVLLTASLSGVARAALPFVEDDYAKAIAAARGRHVPIFLEAWAPW